MLTRRVPVLPVAVVVFGLDTAYLAATASPSPFYFSNVVLHMALGIVLAVVLGRRLGRARAAANWRDRVVLNQLGRVLFLKRQFAEAGETLTRVLAIDPEDLQAHYNLMLAYQGMGNTAAAAREKVYYERFKADEASQAITGPYRQLHRDDNNERQQIHEHRAATPTVKR